MDAVLEHRPTGDAPTVCLECSEPFAAASTRRVFCTSRCKTRSAKRRQADRHAGQAERRCARCGEAKPTEQFSTLNASYCRPCHSTYKRTQRKDPESVMHAGELARYARLVEQDPEHWRKLVLSRYGLTPESFADLLASQGGVCAICGTDEPAGRYGTWHLDHDQACCPTPRGKHGCCGRCIRALLCAACNMGLGKFGDDPARLRAAADYIEMHRLLGRESSHGRRHALDT